MRVTRKLIQVSLPGLLLATLLLLVGNIACAETVMTPRDRAAFDAEMRALNEKYGPKAGAMEQGASSMSEADAAGSETAEATSEPVAAPAVARVPMPIPEGEQAAESALLSAQANQQLSGSTNAGAVSKLRIELSPKNAREFVFDGQSYTQSDLMPILQALKQKHALDYVVLLQAGVEPVQLTHIVELAKISRELLTPAVYQDGKQLRAVDAR